MEGRFGQMEVRFAARRLDAAARALFPHFCAACGDEGEMVCMECRPKLEIPTPGIFSCPGAGCSAPASGVGLRCGSEKCSGSILDSLCSVVEYRGSPMGDLMRSWKYGGVAQAETAVTRMFSGFATGKRSELLRAYAGAIVVPVPLNFLRQASRGFNQAEVLASAFAGALGLRIGHSLLSRVFGGTSQASLDDRSKRAENIAGMFRAARRISAEQRVVLIDDVATTGATLRDCARALKGAGAGEVHAVTLLRR